MNEEPPFQAPDQKLGPPPDKIITTSFHPTHQDKTEHGYQVDPSFNSEEFAEYGAPDPNTFKGVTLQNAQDTLEGEARKDLISMPSDMAAEANSSRLRKLAEDQQAHARDNVFNTTIVNAPSHQVKLGGPDQESVPHSNSGEEVVAQAADIAARMLNTPASGAESVASSESAANPIDDLIDYFHDKKNNMTPDPEKIRQAGTIIAEYFDKAAEAEHADKEFENNLDSITSATDAIMNRYININGVKQRDPAIEEAGAIERLAYDIAVNAKSRRRDVEDLILGKNPKDGLGNTREYTRIADATRNPDQLYGYAEVGKRSAQLLASVAEAGAQNEAVDFVSVGRGVGPNMKVTEEFNDAQYKDYIARHLSSTLRSIKDSNLPVTAA